MAQILKQQLKGGDPMSNRLVSMFAVEAIDGTAGVENWITFAG